MFGRFFSGRLKRRTARRILPAVLYLAAALFSFGLAVEQPQVKPARSPFWQELLGANDGFDFLIFFTGDVSGNFEPCG